MADLLFDAADSLSPKKTKGDKVVKGIYLEREVWDKLQAIADERGIAVTGLASEILRRVVLKPEQ